VCSVPNFREGYCTDDNSRALVLVVLLEETGDDVPEIRLAAYRYAAFIDYAFIPESGRFHNFMSFERRWLDNGGSDDCWGRVLWALGACIGRSRRPDLQRWAMQWFERALAGIDRSAAPRAWAFALLGIHEYFRRLSGDRFVNQMREALLQRLLARFHEASGPDWPWFEDALTYGNAKLPHALILGGRWGGNAEALDIGLRSLRWLVEVQSGEGGHFRPIGSDGFYPRSGPRAQFDQQPIEAYTTMSACLEAWFATREQFWMQEARKAFEWFLGRNDLGRSLYDAGTGGCFDALHVDRLNLNQGAESTLAFLLALQEMRLAENSLEVVADPGGPSNRVAVTAAGTPA